MKTSNHSNETNLIKMSKDSSPTNIHMHHPRLADFYEDFTRPHTSSLTSSNPTAITTTTHAPPPGPNNPNPAGPSGGTTTVTYGSTSPTLVPSFLPIEDIYVAAQYQPPNPEDEDDVVPDQHAAFGIARAMERRREAVWRDLGMEELMGASGGVGGRGGGGLAGVGGVGAGAGGANMGVGSGSAAGVRVRVKESGRRMGGRREVICLR
ncbi:hypothetical protein P170DRAFT_513538 [Aspergillus steynii IBT 23096]|uniref:Uncharacterized protein n=1 Tax=Aspergillus steynii IBT 23096 TaxID=1392250 RepID=A0A2I2FUU1_9EURO|nr:uncharacterized protein P170DRAFT_513538 [Aspergillus steynii IBT 23096]PLB44336.1 hypothetical protein P170DRAFT_513538 [Aspergillus steynii IBT 23096]